MTTPFTAPAIEQARAAAIAAGGATASAALDAALSLLAADAQLAIANEQQMANIAMGASRRILAATDATDALYGVREWFSRHYDPEKPTAAYAELAELLAADIDRKGLYVADDASTVEAKYDALLDKYVHEVDRNMSLDFAQTTVYKPTLRAIRATVVDETVPDSSLRDILNRILDGADDSNNVVDQFDPIRSAVNAWQNDVRYVLTQNGDDTLRDAIEKLVNREDAFLPVVTGDAETRLYVLLGRLREALTDPERLAELAREAAAQA